jgi:two-component system chemotaxis response regulator CheB
LSSRIKILVVDDSVVVRRMVSDTLSADPQLEVVGAAANGKIALARVAQVNPDVVILDVEMPEMDGLETLRRLRQTHPFLPVIMFSTMTLRGAVATLDALSLGANDYVTKPSNVGGAHQAIAQINAQLIPKIKIFCAKAAGLNFTPSARSPMPALPHSKHPAAPSRPAARVEVVAIGVSTGGPNALAEVLPEFPADFPVPVVIVQHMPPLFTKLLAERLGAKAQIKIEEGAPGQALRAGQAFIAPGNYHMTVEQKDRGVRIQTNQDPPENSCRPAVDVLFRSVAQTFGAGVLGVVMTGMGQDGLRGSERIKEAGGQVLIQDEATSVVWGMPGYVAQAGLADKVLPLHLLGPEIVRKVQAGHLLPALAREARAGSQAGGSKA